MIILDPILYEISPRQKPFSPAVLSDFNQGVSAVVGGKSYTTYQMDGGELQDFAWRCQLAGCGALHPSIVALWEYTPASCYGDTQGPQALSLSQRLPGKLIIWHLGNLP